METLFLIKYGELSLKGNNRSLFEKRLCADIRRKLKKIDHKIKRHWGRIYVYCREEDTVRVSDALSRCFGIVSFSKAHRASKNIQAIEKAALVLTKGLLEDGKGERFKIEASRSDKSFSLNSYEIVCRLGDLIRSHFPGLVVDLYHPDWILNVEIRESAYLYGPETRSPGGLPLGSSGRAVLLLSGGIDSPVAGYLMGKRGLMFHALHFHTPPFTSQKALDKVMRITRLLSAYLTGITFTVVPFTDIQIRIKENAPEEEMTLLMRACMMHIAEKVALKSRCNALVTGESLAQVASQTVESLHFTGSVSSLPVFRPLIGLNKEEIVNMARIIGTYETSILPYEDCCTLFRPHHPLTRPCYHRMQHSYRSLEIEELLDEAFKNGRGVSLE